MVTRILIIAFLFLSFPALAKDDYCKENRLGWHFYCDDGKEDTEEDKSNRNGSSEEASRMLKDTQEKLETLKTMAVMFPTESNIRNYIAYQNQILNNVQKFSEAWKKVIWQNPELDYQVKHPISVVGNQLNNELKTQEKQKLISTLNQRYGLFFFYSSKCPYCHQFSPILKVFAAHYNLEVMAVSMDGGILPQWPDTKLNQAQADNLGMSGKPVPAVLLFDSKTQEVIPVSFGLVAVDELENRIVSLITQGRQE
jgi:conjugal transfer pilus assembly protein TraF